MTSEPASAIRIPRATFASIVTDRLRTSIVNGSLKPGSQLSEVELANSFGVSRGPVREALQRLVQEGLLLSEPHRGVFIPVLTDDDVLDIYLAREALESAAVRTIVANDSSAAASRALDKFVTEMEKAEAAGDWEAVGNFDVEFHVALVDASGSRRLRRMFSTVISETRLCLGVLTAADAARSNLVQEHRQVCDLMQEGETELALDVLKKHFDDAVVTLLNRHDRPRTTVLEAR